MMKWDGYAACDKKWIQRLARISEEKGDPLRGLGMYRMIIFKMDLKEIGSQDVKCSSNSVQGPVADSCEKGNEPSASII